VYCPIQFAEQEKEWLLWNLFFVPRAKIPNPDSTFDAEFKYVSICSPSLTVFIVTAKLNVKKE
jgi:hypothetical protein